MRNAVRLSVIVACSVAVLCCAGVARAQSVDPGFNPGADQVVVSMAEQPDGKIIVGGGFTHLGGGGTGTTVRNHIGRLNVNGSVDSTFNPGANSIVQAIAVQPDGKILIGGNFLAVGGGTGTTPRSYLARINPNGTVDTSFNPGANNVVYSLVLQPDGKILVGGAFTKLGGGGSGTTTRNAIGRLNADGSLDSFNPGARKTGGVPIVYTMALQPDGSVVVGGYFNGLGGGTGATVRNYIGRINGAGGIDTTFNPGATFYVYALALQADGKIVAGGDFVGLGGGAGSGPGSSPRLHIGRIDTDGSVDLDFDPGAESIVHTLGVQADGKILAGGYFKWMGGAGDPVTRSVRNYIGRLNADGTVDSAFNPGAGNIVDSVAIQPDGTILIGGHFSTVGGGTGLTTPRSLIARFTPTNAAVQNLALTGNGTIETWMRGGSAPEVSRVTFEFSFDGSFYSLLGDGTRISGGWQLTSGVNLPISRKLYIRARGYYGSGFQNGSGSIVASILVTHPRTAPGNYDGDGKTDLTIFRPSTGTFWISQSSTNYTTYVTKPWGIATDIPVPGDYDGDGKADVAIFRPSTGTWWILQSSSNYTTYLTRLWGAATDIAVPGDYDGDGKTDLAVFRPSTGTWWILQSSTNYTTYITKPWGIATDIAVPGDYDGDGKTDIAIYRPSAGTWWILQSSTNFTSYVTRLWGAATDIAVPGDYDGDGKTDIAIYRPSAGTWWILQSSTNYTTYVTKTWGAATDIPVSGDFDGDGGTDIAIYRPSTGTWWILLSSTNFTSYVTQQWGLSTDMPVSRRP